MAKAATAPAGAFFANWRQNIIYIGFVVIFIVFALTLNDKGFLNPNNLLNIVRQTAMIAVMAVASGAFGGTSDVPTGPDGTIGPCSRFTTTVTTKVYANFDLRARTLTFTAEADLLVWWHADTVPQVQGAYHRLRASDLGRSLEPVWSVVGLHRPSEFNREHVPSFLAGAPALEYVCVYPFVRSYDWYVLDPAEGHALLMQKWL